MCVPIVFSACCCDTEISSPSTAFENTLATQSSHTHTPSNFIDGPPRLSVRSSKKIRSLCRHSTTSTRTCRITCWKCSSLILNSIWVSSCRVKICQGNLATARGSQSQDDQFSGAFMNFYFFYRFCTLCGVAGGDPSNGAKMMNEPLFTNFDIGRMALTDADNSVQAVFDRFLAERVHLLVAL